MGAEEATLNLQALQAAYPDAPWALTFSFGRALQDGVLKAWAGKPECGWHTWPSALADAAPSQRALCPALPAGNACQPGLCLQHTRSENAAVAQELLRELARVNSEAARGVWDEQHPTPARSGAQRLVGIAKHSYSAERKESGNIFNW